MQDCNKTQHIGWAAGLGIERYYYQYIIIIYIIINTIIIVIIIINQIRYEPI
jgi:hypothetical protein